MFLFMCFDVLKSDGKNECLGRKMQNGEGIKNNLIKETHTSVGFTMQSVLV